MADGDSNYGDLRDGAHVQYWKLHDGILDQFTTDGKKALVRSADGLVEAVDTELLILPDDYGTGTADMQRKRKMTEINFELGLGHQQQQEQGQLVAWEMQKKKTPGVAEKRAER